MTRNRYCPGGMQTHKVLILLRSHRKTFHIFWHTLGALLAHTCCCHHNNIVIITTSQQWLSPMPNNAVNKQQNHVYKSNYSIPQYRICCTFPTSQLLNKAIPYHEDDVFLPKRNEPHSKVFEHRNGGQTVDWSKISYRGYVNASNSNTSWRVLFAFAIPVGPTILPPNGSYPEWTIAAIHGRSIHASPNVHLAFHQDSLFSKNDVKESKQRAEEDR